MRRDETNRPEFSVIRARSGARHMYGATGPTPSARGDIARARVARPVTGPQRTGSYVMTGKRSDNAADGRSWTGYSDPTPGSARAAISDRYDAPANAISRTRA